MAMRHLVTGQNSCAPDGASSSNPLNAFANAVLGQSSKTQVSLRSLSSASVVWNSEALVDAAVMDRLGSTIRAASVAQFVNCADFSESGTNPVILGCW